MVEAMVDRSDKKVGSADFYLFYVGSFSDSVLKITDNISTVSVMSNFPMVEYFRYLSLSNYRGVQIGGDVCLFGHSDSI